MTEPRAAALRELINKGSLKKFSKNELIQSSDLRQNLCLIKSGFVKRFMIKNDGSIGVQSIYGPGYFFPFTLVFEVLFDYRLYDGPETYYYEAMCDVALYSMGGDELKQALTDNPSLYKDLLFVSGRRFKSNIQRLENVNVGSSYHRVAHQLLFFGKNMADTTASGQKILIPLTQQDIADVLSTTRETVSVSISQLRKKGLIKTGKYIIIPDMGKLEAEAYGSE